MFDGDDDVRAFGVHFGARGDAALEPDQAFGERVVAVDLADPAGEVPACGVVA